MAETPVIDGRSSDEIRDDAASLVPHYVEKWNLEGDAVGDALLTLFGEMAADVVSGLNQLPEKHFVTFLDHLGFDRAPPQRARLPLSVQVADGAQRNVVIQPGTRAIAAGVDGTEQVFEVTPGNGFEATPANLQHVFSADPVTDRLYDALTPLENSEETPLFGGTDRQEHRLYIGHADLLTLRNDSRFLVRIRTNAPTSDITDVLRWEFYGSEGDEANAWRSLVPIGGRDASTRLRSPTLDDVYRDLRPELGTYGYGALAELPPVRRRSLVRDLVATSPHGERVSSPSISDARTDVNEVFLDRVERVVRRLQPTSEQSPGEHRSLSLVFELPAGAEMVEHEVNGVETMWIRATLPADALMSSDVVVSGVSLAAGPALGRRSSRGSDDGNDDNGPGNNGGTNGDDSLRLYPDALLHNDVPLPNGDESEGDVFPYGHTPQSRDAFYVASAEAFSKTGTEATLQFTGSVGLPDTRQRLSWEYWNGDGWARIPELTRPTGDSLSFTVPSDLEPTSVVGHEGHWIRARLLDNEYGQVKYRRVPFAEVLGPSTGEPDQTFEFENPPVDEVSISVDERAGGTNPNWVEWHQVPDFADSGPEDQHYVVDEEKGTVTFGNGSRGAIPPEGTDNIKTTYRGGTYDWTLEPDDVPHFRALTIDYHGEDDEIDIPAGIGSDPSRPGTIGAPSGTGSTSSGPRLHVVAPEHLVSYNNLTYEMHHLENDGTLDFVRPFVGPEDETQTVYMGFDRPLTDGPIQVFVSMVEKPFPDEFYPRIRWEYCVDAAGAAWEPISARDGTAGLTECGIVELVFPSETTACRRFGVKAHWIRARITNDSFGHDFSPLFPDVGSPDTAVHRTLEPCDAAVATQPPAGMPSTTPPTLRGIYPNTGWAADGRSIESEPLGSSDGAPTQTFSLASSPATSVAVEVDELAALSTSERRTLVESKPDEVVEVTDERGNVRSVWVEWALVPDLAGSESGDRHYTFDWTTGTVTFGDGVNGRIPPVGRNNVHASYRTGGGSNGNVTAGAVESLVSSIAFVESVSNPEGADGGADAESTPQVLDRAPKELRDRNRAVTAVDFERIAASTSRKLARVKALTAMDRAGKYTPGVVTLLVVPRSENVRPTPSIELRQQVLDRVRERASATLAIGDRLVVRGPSYVSVSVMSTLVATQGTSVSSLEATVDAAVTAYLHPLTGGPEGTGWGFGDLPCLSDLFALFERVDDVDHVERLAVTFSGDGSSAPLTVTVGEEEPSIAADALVYSGTHDISVTERV